MKGEEQHQHQNQYGTFNPSAPPLQSSPPVTGFPQPAPPPGAYHYGQGYQSVPIVAQGTPVQIPRRHHDRLPCCGIGLGWFLFIIGFFLAAVPWYVGALLLLCSRVDYREKPGYVACTVAAVISAIAIVFGITKGTDVW